MHLVSMIRLYPFNSRRCQSLALPVCASAAAVQPGCGKGPARDGVHGAGLA
jgi:hypothetical protein